MKNTIEKTETLESSIQATLSNLKLKATTTKLKGSVYVEFQSQKNLETFTNFLTKEGVMFEKVEFEFGVFVKPFFNN